MSGHGHEERDSTSGDAVILPIKRALALPDVLVNDARGTLEGSSLYPSKGSVFGVGLGLTLLPFKFFGRLIKETIDDVKRHKLVGGFGGNLPQVEVSESTVKHQKPGFFSRAWTNVANFFSKDKVTHSTDVNSEQVSGSTVERKVLEPDVSFNKVIKLFSKQFKPNLGRVLYPSSGAHEISSAFPKETVVTYVDKDKATIDARKDVGQQALGYDVLDHAPDVGYDLVLLYNPSIDAYSVNRMAKLVNPGQYLMCNNYHNTAAVMQNNPEFELVGVVSSKRDAIDTKNLSVGSSSDASYIFRRKSVKAQFATPGGVQTVTNLALAA